MKDNNKRFRYKYLTPVLFLIVVFVMSALNFKEAVFNYSAAEEKPGLREIAADLGSVDSVTYPFINLNGLYQNLMQRDYMYDADPDNDTVKNRNGQLVSSHSSAADKALTETAEKLRKSADWCADRGIPLIYFQAGNKMVMTSEQAMPGIPNNTYYKLETFLGELDAQKIEYIDTRDWIETSAAEAFYITDHHWTTDTCFSIAQKICQYLNEEHDFGIDPALFSEDNFNFITHKKAFLGAEGRRTGIYFAGLDDFTEIYPKYDTDFKIEISDKDSGHSERQGSFTEAVMDTTKDVEHYSFEDSAYYEYWGGDYGRVHVENLKNKDGKKVILFKDSYGIPVSALLTPALGSMDIIDLRYYSDDKTIKTIIEETQPDAVLYVYGPGYLAKKSMFTIK